MIYPNLHHGESWGPQFNKDEQLLERIYRRDKRMMRGLEHLFCKERLGGDLINA